MKKKIKIILESSSFMFVNFKHKIWRKSCR